MEGSKNLTIKANDTDVLVIVFLQELDLCKMWMMFGQGSNLRMIAVHDNASAIGPERTEGLLSFHAFTGSNITSAFHEKGKKSAWLT